MLLGKRPRHRIRRTTSVTSISVVDLEDLQEPSSARQNPSGEGGPPRAAVAPGHHDGDGGGGEDVDMGGFGPYDRQSSFLAMVSPRNYNSMEAEGAHFLTTCGLCKRRLFPGDGRDIYMYRGDTAFCSLECREEQVKQDEMKEKHKNPNVAANSRRQARKASPN